MIGLPAGQGILREAILMSASLYGWGKNDVYQIGTGFNNETITPEQNTSISDWAEIVSGADFSIGRKNNGTIWAIGGNYYGQCGIGSTVNVTSWTQIGTDTDWTHIAANGYSAYGLRGTGVAYSWGRNNYGQLGCSSTVDKLTPTLVSGGYTDWVQLSAGWYHAGGIRSDKTLWCWGDNYYGQVGDDTLTQRTSPVQVTFKWAAVEAGGNHTLAIDKNGVIYGAGNAAQGQLNFDLNVIQQSYRELTALNGWTGNTIISAGTQSSFVVDSSGYLWGCGDNNDALIDSANIGVNQTAFFKIGTETWEKVSCNYNHILAVNAVTHKLHAWGRNSNYQIGNGTTTTPVNYSATPIDAVTTTWATISAGYRHSWLTKQDGTLWACGSGLNGRLGNGSTSNLTTLTQIGAATNWTAASAGYDHSIGIAGGLLYTCGSNVYGQLGNESALPGIDVNTPTQILTSVTNFTGCYAAKYFTAAWTADGKLYMFGQNAFTATNTVTGKLGVGTSTENYSTPQLVLSDITGTFSISLGDNHVISLEYSGNVTNRMQVWGDNYYWQLARGRIPAGAINGDDVTSPLVIQSDKKWMKLACGTYHSLGIKDLTLTGYGSLWSWGNGYFKQLGIQQNTASKKTPQIIDSDLAWFDVSATNHSLAARNDSGLSTVWGCGHNLNGQCADNTGYAHSTFTKEYLGITTWSSIKAGYYHSLAKKSDGTLYASGFNYFGQLGITDTAATRSVAIQSQIDTTPSYADAETLIYGTDWKNIAIGLDYVVGTRGTSQTVNDLYAYGVHDWGQLGLGDYTDPNDGVQNTLDNQPYFVHSDTYSTPVDKTVTLPSNIQFISCGYAHTLIITSTGDIKGAGANVYGQLGTGNTTQSVEYITAFSSVSGPFVSCTCGYDNSFAIKSDGTIWACGDNGGQRLGDGTSSHKTTPINITGTNNELLTHNFIRLYGRYHTFGAIDNSGQLWMWGDNGHGQCGNNSTTVVGLPIRTGINAAEIASGDYSLAVYSTIATGVYHTVGIRTNGDVYVWGENSSGQLGIGTFTDSLLPVKVTGITGIQVVATENITLLLANDGKLWICGYLGGQYTGDQKVFERFGSLSNWSSIYSGQQWIYAINTLGELYRWHDLGNLRQLDASVFTQVGSGSTWSSINAGFNFSNGIRT